MRIAVPLSGGRLSQHFGHSEQFLFVDADLEQKQVLGRNVETAPEHAPRVLPKWLAEHGVDVVIASGMGEHARGLLAASSVQVLTGVSATDPEVLVADFIHARLETGANYCDHSGHSCNH
ncbi:MAG: NifB/NifX family molybdenum-iron cluster-binding protein [Acidobacteriia bacterium]|nr:NifB/NifX family molybdenum-iron cluster-binding protein [Terriglobia bacterium]